MPSQELVRFDGVGERKTTVFRPNIDDLSLDLRTRETEKQTAKRRDEGHGKNIEPAKRKKGNQRSMGNPDVRCTEYEWLGVFVSVRRSVDGSSHFRLVLHQIWQSLVVPSATQNELSRQAGTPQ